VSKQWHDNSALDPGVESPISQFLRETILQIFVKEPAQYPELDRDDTSCETLSLEERNENALPSTPPPQKAVVFCPLAGQFPHLMSWLTEFFGG
jgi:hypothetical protein